MNNTLKNGLTVLEYLSGSGEAHSVSEIAEFFKLPKSHACRLLKTLVESGHVEQDAKSRKYRISLKILTLSHACLSRMGIRHKLRPFLKELAQNLKQDVFLQVPLEGNAVIVDVEYPTRQKQDMGIVIGGVNQLHTSAGGKLCAAYLPPETLDAVLQKAELCKLTDKTITDRGQLKQELARIRQEGVATTDSERDEGICAAAAPIFNCEGDFIAALGVVLPRGINSAQTWDKFKEATISTAEAASYALGYGLKRLV